MGWCTSSVACTLDDRQEHSPIHLTKKGCIVRKENSVGTFSHLFQLLFSPREYDYTFLMTQQLFELMILELAVV